ncbi:hypothetical protein [Chryseobacterium aquaticum]|uniref:hypothetical protein n=1 Tax=Chryseobacterium aquaticum TaxID=452084 RepID=UPI002FC66B77
MFTNTSWASYITATALLSAGWYLFVGFRYYYGDIKAIISGKRKLQFRATRNNPIDEEITSVDNSVTSLEDSNNDNPVLEEIDELIGKVKSIFRNASGKPLPKDEFTEYLTLLFIDYPSLMHSPHRPSLNELIATECQKQGNFTLTETEIDHLWNETE